MLRLAPNVASPPIQPERAIVPILLVSRKTRQFIRLLGTGFFYSSRPRILSVAHVLAVQPSDDEAMGILDIRPEGGIVDTLHLVTNVSVSTSHDLAVADVPGAKNWLPLRIRSEE